jgi:CTP:molybdopterin cytidylyltransferase MocA
VKPALVILAAGASRRLGEPKALVDLAGRTPLARLLAAGAVLDDLPALVVTGADHERIAAALPEGVEAAHNPHWELGRTGGIALASRLRPGRDLCLAPVDVPLVPRAVFAALLAAWERAGSPARGWLAPRCRPAGAPRAAHGHPVVAGRELLRALRELPPDRPLRCLRDSADPLLAVDVEAAEVLDDLDRPEDLARLRRRSPPG